MMMPRTALALVAAIAAAAAAVSAQQAQEPTPTFRARTDLRVWNISVTDREGRPIEGLGVNDFTISENGVRQEIAFVEYQRLEPPAPVVRNPVVADIVPAPPLDPAARTEASRITIPGAGDTR